MTSWTTSWSTGSQIPSPLQSESTQKPWVAGQEPGTSTGKLRKSVPRNFVNHNLATYGLNYFIPSVPVKIPAACLASPQEFFGGQTRFHLQDKFHQLISFNSGKAGGHFAAFEVPQVFAADVIQFFNLVERNTTVAFSTKKKVWLLMWSLLVSSVFWNIIWFDYKIENTYNVGKWNN